MERKILDELMGFEGTAGIIIQERDSEEKIAYNESESFPAASIIKLYILWVLNKYVKEGKANYEERIPLGDEEKVGGFGILKFMDADLTPTVKDLATLMVCLSDNTATNILIDYLGILNINNEIQKAGFEDTFLTRKMMDENAMKKGRENYTSPRDTHRIIQYLTAEKLTRDMLKGQMCNSKLPLYFFRQVEMAHKTGDIVGCEHDAGRIYFKNKEVDVIVLTKNLVNNKDGVMLHNNIGEIVYRNFV